MKRGVVMWCGAWIDIQDVEGNSLKKMNLPVGGSMKRFMKQLLKWAADEGVVICVGQSVSGQMVPMAGEGLP